MYICFPFSAVSLGRSDMTLGEEHLGTRPGQRHRPAPEPMLVPESPSTWPAWARPPAADFTLKKLLPLPACDFPLSTHTHYAGGGSFCHPPDHDHGGVAMTALQEMLMQTDGKRILLGPAWPAEWDCDSNSMRPTGPLWKAVSSAARSSWKK